ncbi:MAG TPA: DUF559 domain-containing protein [Terracidiphilus sp.]
MEIALRGALRAPEFSSWQTLFIDEGHVSAFDDFPPLYVQEIVVAPQVLVGAYMADFAILAKASGKMPPRFAIECDGFDYHDATAESATKDRVRDRYFNARYVTPIRFSGSEINADPDACAKEALNLIANRAANT